jgi:hypothetical protein
MSEKDFLEVLPREVLHFSQELWELIQRKETITTTKLYEISKKTEFHNYVLSRVWGSLCEKREQVIDALFFSHFGESFIPGFLLAGFFHIKRLRALTSFKLGYDWNAELRWKVPHQRPFPVLRKVTEFVLLSSPLLLPWNGFQASAFIMPVLSTLQGAYVYSHHLCAVCARALFVRNMLRTSRVRLDDKVTPKNEADQRRSCSCSLC